MHGMLIFCSKKKIRSLQSCKKYLNLNGQLALEWSIPMPRIQLKIEDICLYYKTSRLCDSKHKWSRISIMKTLCGLGHWYSEGLGWLIVLNLPSCMEGVNNSDIVDYKAWLK